MECGDGRYAVVDQIGEGAHGSVFKARDGDRTVALKRVKLRRERQGVPLTAVREISLMDACDHPNIMPILDIVASDSLKKEKGESVHLVFPFMEHDLSGLLANEDVTLVEPQVKYYMACMLKALDYLHTRGILHRDIKGSNILLDNRGGVMLADFGLARWEKPACPHYTNRMITLWYRPIEILYGETQYSAAADMWSLGCIFAELLSGEPLFPGRTELDQISKIFHVCGTPSSLTAPVFEKYPWYSLLMPKKKLPDTLHSRFRKYGSHAFDLLSSLLSYDPSKRLSAAEALQHAYFTTKPLPWTQKEAALTSESHTYKAKQLRKERKDKGISIPDRQRGIKTPPPTPESRPVSSMERKRPRSPHFERSSTYRQPRRRL